MSTKVSVICFKSKKLKDGTSPLMLRICKPGKRIYTSLGISVKQEWWDFNKNTPKPSCPNRESIELIISTTLSTYNKRILEFEALNIEYTPQTLIDSFNSNLPKTPQTVADVFKQQIKELEDAERRGYMKSVQQVFNSLLKYTNNRLEIPFSIVDSRWLKRYETWLRKQNLKDNTIGVRMRTFRMIYNAAIEQGIVAPDKYPFKSYKVTKLVQKTAKRALSKSDLQKVVSYRAKNNHQQFAIDIFAFTYYCGGINFVDIANLTTDNIIDGRLVYERQKTHATIALPFQEKALELISKYHNDESQYLFPIFSSYHKTPIQKENRVHKVITKVNKYLKEIGQELGLNLSITTYVARHTQATVMKRAGVSVSVISGIMGHSSEQVTQYYLDSFENSQFNDAMSKL